MFPNSRSGDVWVPIGVILLAVLLALFVEYGLGWD